MGGPGSDMLFFGAMLFIMIVFFFVPKIREQSAVRKMLDALKRGDKVVTHAGMHGEVHAVKDNVVTVKVAENVRIDFDKSAIARVLPEAGAASDRNSVEKPART